jgi:hypothetical protein
MGLSPRRARLEATKGGRMRIRRAVLLAVLAAAASALSALGASASNPAGTGYLWAQPGTAPVNAPMAQPPAWIPTTPAAVITTIPGSDYPWAQPGAAPVTVPFGQP